MKQTSEFRGSNQEPIDTTNDAQMVALGLRKPLTSFTYYVDVKEGKMIRIGRDYQQKSLDEKKLLKELKKNVENTQSFDTTQGHATKVPIKVGKLTVYVQNTGTTDPTAPRCKQAKYFKTTHTFHNVVENDVAWHLEQIKDKLHLIILSYTFCEVKKQLIINLKKKK